jgi:hypothetical protein
MNKPPEGLDKNNLKLAPIEEAFREAAKLQLQRKLSLRATRTPSKPFSLRRAWMRFK